MEGIVGAASAPVAAGLIEAAAQRIWNRSSANAVKAMTSAADGAGVDVQEFLERLLSAPNRQELLANALEAAARATLEPKIKALVTALKTGALTSSASEVDHELLFVRAMADFEAAHITV
jgi:4'-phosphopantetheinyl transferase EntD